MYDDDLRFLDSYSDSNILITGANGNTGRAVWNLLFSNPSVNINKLTLFKGPNSHLSEVEVKEYMN